MGNWKHISLAICLLCSNWTVQAQAKNDPAQISKYIEPLRSLIATESALETGQKMCAALGSASEQGFQAALKDWKKRNADYLKVLPFWERYFRKAMRQASYSEDEIEAEIAKLNSGAAKSGSKNVQDSFPGKKANPEACSRVVKALDAGNHEVNKNPKNAAALRELAQKQREDEIGMR
ncbi:hypothetical protein V8J88_24255 [Massilia sp. W12]|uniref:hypothetical protein n=1 Tax=Massilia sp. W12 TaxID=3126507 RepID=UPI0030D28306